MTVHPWLLVWFGIGLGAVLGVGSYHVLLRPHLPLLDGVPVTPCPRCDSTQTRVLATPLERQASCFVCGKTWDPHDVVAGTPDPLSGAEMREKRKAQTPRKPSNG